MGKIKIRTLGLEDEEKKEKDAARIKREEKIKRSIAEGKEAKAKEAVSNGEAVVEAKPAKKEAKEEVKEKKTKKVDSKKQPHVHGANYKKSLKMIDANKAYDLKTAVDLLKKVKFASFDETVEVHLNLKESNVKGEVTLPHGTGKSVRVAIVDDAVLADIEKGTINFDILLATPATMPKLVKFARVLGPKGLMPNPKNGTVVPNPEEAKKKFTGGAVRFKSEAKFPLLHQSIGKSSFENEKIIANLKSFFKAVGPENIVAAFVSTSMSPSIKLNLEQI